MALHARFEESQQQVCQLEKSLQALKVSLRKRITLAQMPRHMHTNASKHVHMHMEMNTHQCS